MYFVRKRIKGKRISKSFENIRDAIEFNRYGFVIEKEVVEPIRKANLNGNCEQTFSEVWFEYMDYQKSNSISYHDLLERKYESVFDEELKRVVINQIDPKEISKFLKRAKLVCHSRRESFKFELKILKSFFNYINDLIDYTFHNPIKSLHFKLGVIKNSKDKLKKRKSLTTSELEIFFKTLEEPLSWFAKVQFFLGARVQEVVALNVKYIDFKRNKLIIKDVAVFDHKSKHVKEIKRIPKNGEIREIALQGLLRKILKPLLDKANSKGFIFHNGGKLYSYRFIQNSYDRAFKKMGIYEEVSGTHTMRHTAATIARKLGGVDAVMAITGHKDVRMAQHYGKLDHCEKNKEIMAQLELEVFSE